MSFILLKEKKVAKILFIFKKNYDYKTKIFIGVDDSSVSSII